MKSATRIIVGSAVCAGLVLAWMFGSRHDTATTPVLGSVVITGAAPVTGPIGPVAQPAPALAAMHVERFLQTGWLRGTDVDGGWGVWRGGVLQPSLTLRRRFDYLLASIGEVSVADLRQWVAVHAKADLGDDGAAAVLVVWDAYVGLRQTGGDAALDFDDPQSWQRSIDARNARRRAALGPAWAYAFFSEDDQQLVAQLQRRSDIKSGKAVPVDEQTALISAPDHPLGADEALQRDARRVAVFGADAAQRMHAQDEVDAQFQQRLGAAKARAAEIANDPQLSAQQREQQQSADLAQRFNGSEMARARALLSVSSTGG